MRICSWNVNGLRAIFKKDFQFKLNLLDCDILCLQEIKMSEEFFNDSFLIPGYFCYFNFSLKKGYSGVGVYCKEKPIKIKKELGLEDFDNESRFIELEFKDFILINVYMPQGGLNEEKFNLKIKSFKKLIKYLKSIKDKKVIVVGDFNIAKEEIDVYKKIDSDMVMFTDQERGFLEELESYGYKDAFREFNPNLKKYSWFSYMNQAKIKNEGWRIDYIFSSLSIFSLIKRPFILNEIEGSDHSVVGVDL